MFVPEVATVTSYINHLRLLPPRPPLCIQNVKDMAPIRRYLRITKHSVLEVRIYLDKPSDAPWLLSSRDPVLPRIMAEIRPKVLPKLREENENAKKKGGKKKKGIKDVVSTEEFEVVIFLKELSTRHVLLTKQKSFVDKPRLKSNSSKLTGWLNNTDNLTAGSEGSGQRATDILQEDEDDEVVELYNIPAANTGSKRKAQGEDDEALILSSDEEPAFQTQEERGSKRHKRAATRPQPASEEVDDKKKLAMNTSFDGFRIYGRTLCLVVKRKGRTTAREDAPLGGSQMMEKWVSTQAAQEAGLEEDEDG